MQPLKLGKGMLKSRKQIGKWFLECLVLLKWLCCRELKKEKLYEEGSEKLPQKKDISC